jgi:hypothetical protein
VSDTAAALVADLRGLHQRAAHPNDDKCWICHHPYPCPTVRLCDEVDTRVKWADQLLQREVIRRKQYRAERDRLASLVEKLRPYLTHRDYCEDGAICVCGLADLLTEMENQ